MKYLIFFLLLTSVVFSQNYNYAIEEAQVDLISAPTSLIANNITVNSVNLSWIAPNSNNPILEYKIYNNSNLLATSAGAATKYTLTGLTSETSYSLTIRATDLSGKISGDSNFQVFTTNSVLINNNQEEEIAYFNAYLLPISQKATLQQALDQYKSVRLEKGDYTGTDIILRSNQKLYGHPSLTRVSNIKIAAGSSNVHLENLAPIDCFITLEAGGVISGFTFKTIKWAILKGTNVQLVDNTILNFEGAIRLDCSQSGYFRNNKIIKHQIGTIADMLVMKGNLVTPSYGNVNLHTNFRTPHGDVTDISVLQSATFVGVDSESWNYMGKGSKSLFVAQNIDDLKIADFGGGNGGSTFKTRSFDIDAKNAFVLGETNNGTKGILSKNTDMFLINGIKFYDRPPGKTIGYDFLGNVEGSNAITYNGVEQTATSNDNALVNSLASTLIGTQRTTWKRPKMVKLPDPMGENWKTHREGKPDQKDFIQDLINKNGIAELPAGVFYIGSTLLMPLDFKHGIVGQGSGKTIIVGLTDDFPLLSLTTGFDGNFTIANLTLQGGSTGIYASQEYGPLNIAYQYMSHVIFRDQNFGIHLNKTGGFDNCFLDNVSFINSKIGFFKEPMIGNSGELTSAYVDKTMFYKNQFLNCDTAISLLATRADNLNAWVNCIFDGGKKAFIMQGQNNSLIANSDFTNFSGDHIIKSNAISIYSSDFFNNKITGSTVSAVNSNIEGCNFLDNSPLYSPVIYNKINNHVVNSVITGSFLTVIPENQGFGVENSIYINCKFESKPALNKLIVKVKGGIPTVIINKDSNPFPQLLVKH
ncbi:hypothetical protein RCH18_002540 [Flavobacterium sp. PL11]|uniref:fibronectin type III domain-containing protein n=1 Tax=Flavobacterium sp. PL11 TaxID=3071717 RepID=UPI002E086902|nr:hypothetical protein [Flavobacterium sp. PL11]